jgi:nitroreductase
MKEPFTGGMEPYRMLLAKRETRLYLAKPVPDEVVYKILEAGRLAGSAKNRQPWEFILIRDRTGLEELSRHGRFASHLSRASFAVVIVIPDTYVQDRLDAGRAAQNMMLAAHFLGVGSCPITLHDEEGAKSFLNIPKSMRIAICIAFGYSAEGKPRGKVLRKEWREILHIEQYGKHYIGQL